VSEINNYKTALGCAACCQYLEAA